MEDLFLSSLGTNYFKMEKEECHVEIIELKTATICLREDGIMHVHIKSGAEMQIGDAMQVVKAMGKLGNKKKFPVLIDCEAFSSVDKEAWLFSKSKDANIYTSADAIAYHSMAHKLLADFFIKNNPSEIPTKIFQDNESAIEWLKTFKKNYKEIN